VTLSMPAEAFHTALSSQASINRMESRSSG